GLHLSFLQFHRDDVIAEAVMAVQDDATARPLKGLYAGERLATLEPAALGLKVIHGLDEHGLDGIFFCRQHHAASLGILARFRDRHVAGGVCLASTVFDYQCHDLPPGEWALATSASALSDHS